MKVVCARQRRLPQTAPTPGVVRPAGGRKPHPTRRDWPRVRVIVNAAMSLDGKIALSGGGRLRLSDEVDWARVHQLRASVDAVAVGIGTVLADDPRLTARPRDADAPSPQPWRVVFDSHGRLPASARVLAPDDRALIVTTSRVTKSWPRATTLAVGAGERVDLPAALAQLAAAHGIKSLMVEGGATLIGALLAANLVDELRVYVAPLVVGGGAPTLADGPGATGPGEVLRLRLLGCAAQGEGALLSYGRL